jgi:hypothetical protein
VIIRSERADRSPQFFVRKLANQTVVAITATLPFELGGVRVSVMDSPPNSSCLARAESILLFRWELPR